MHLSTPLQILLIFLSTFEFLRIFGLNCVVIWQSGSDVTVPSIRPPVASPAGLPAVPTVADPRGVLPPPLVVPGGIRKSWLSLRNLYLVGSGCSRRYQRRSDRCPSYSGLRDWRGP